MFNKHIKNSIIVAFLVLLMSNVSFAANTIVDTSNLDQGVVSINYNQNSTSKIKVSITKGNERENYDLKDNMIYPLQFGNGEYNVAILEQVTGNQYRQIGKETVRLQLKDENTLFLQSTHMVDWNNNMAAIKKAKEITKNSTTDEEKVTAIYNFVTNNIKYDFSKASTVKAGYLPSIDETLETKTGICYDYSVLTAAMLRSLDIPTKLIMGYSSDITEYHAWNEVYLNNQWITIDTTADSVYAQNNMSISMTKNQSQYKVQKNY